jgi:hypothetical protein
MDYEYRVIPAPRRLKRIKGVSSTAELFAATLTETINAEARGGWEYVRSESLAAEEPGGWLRRGAVVEETMMIFRRPRRQAFPEPAPEQHDPEVQRTRPVVSAQRGPAPGPRRDPEPHVPAGDREPPRGEDIPTLLRPVPRHPAGDKR